MKTIRTILATFGVTTLLYGLFALIAVRVNPAFTGRSIYQMFRDTGFVALVIGIGCVLSFVILTVAIVSFRDDGARKKSDFLEDDSDEAFLEEETVPEERAEEADESWSPEIKRKQRRALLHTEEPSVDLFDDEDDEDPISVRDSFDDETVFERPTDEESAFAPEAEPIAEQTADPEPQQDAPEQAEEPERANTKQCSYCGKTIDADSAFCIYCGNRV